VSPSKGEAIDVDVLARRFRKHYHDAFGDDRDARARAESEPWAEGGVADVVHSIVHEGDDPLPLLDALLSVAEAEDDLEFLFFLAAGLIEDVIVDRKQFRDRIAERCRTDGTWRFAVANGVWVAEDLLPTLPELLSTPLAASAVPSARPPERRSRTPRRTWRSQRAQARRRRH
jgi:hypothetical protein